MPGKLQLAVIDLETALADKPPEDCQLEPDQKKHVKNVVLEC